MKWFVNLIKKIPYAEWASSILAGIWNKILLPPTKAAINISEKIGKKAKWELRDFFRRNILKITIFSTALYLANPGVEEIRVLWMCITWVMLCDILSSLIAYTYTKLNVNKSEITIELYGRIFLGVAFLTGLLALAFYIPQFG